MRPLAALLLGLTFAGCQTREAGRAAMDPAPVVETPWRPPLAPCEPQLVRVVDGDTVDVIAAGLPVRCRLVRIDCPERLQPGFEEATEFTRAWLAAATTLHFHSDHRDTWNRPLIDITRDNDPVSLSNALIAAHHARVAP